MFLSLQSAVRFASLMGLAVAMVGCSLTPKNDMANNSAAKSGAKNATTTTGSPEFTIKKRLDDPAKVYVAYAVWHEQEGNLVEARNSYAKVLEKNSKNIDAILGLARLDIAQNRMDDAENRLQKAQKLGPKNPQVAVTRGQFYMSRNDMPHAVEQMKLAHTLAPDDVSCSYHLGVVQARMGDLESAQASFTEAVGPAGAQYNIGYILYDQGNIAAAEERLQRAIALKPDLAQAQSLLITVRQKKAGRPMEVAKGSPFPQFNAAASGIQPASYSEVSGPGHRVELTPAK